MSDTSLNTSAAPRSAVPEHPELQQQEQEWFDLKPIEKKLCAYSFGLGIILLVIFISVFELFH